MVALHQPPRSSWQFSFTDEISSPRQLTIDDLPPPKAMRIPGYWMPGTRPVWWNRSDLWQARLWLGHRHGGEISLGLHPNMQTAHEVWSAVIRAYSRLIIAGDYDKSEPRAVIAWEVARNVWPAKAGTFRLLPKWVHAIKGGAVTRYAAEAEDEGRRYSSGIFDCPCDAFRSLWSQIEPLMARSAPIRRSKPTIFYPSLFDTHLTPN